MFGIVDGILAHADGETMNLMSIYKAIPDEWATVKGCEAPGPLAGTLRDLGFNMNAGTKAAPAPAPKAKAAKHAPAPAPKAKAAKHAPAPAPKAVEHAPKAAKHAPAPAPKAVKHAKHAKSAKR